ncbi:MAG: diguanylate cyclase [Spirochaetales bacterium]|nr:diguanylate cyclase [Spirochaetales bacterium]
MYPQFDYQTSFFFISLLFLLLFNMIYNKQHFSISNRWFMKLIAAEIAVLILEILSWRYEGIPGPRACFLNQLINFLFFFSNVWVPVIWLNYIDFKIFGSVERLKRKGYYSYYLIISLVLLLINLKTQWIFSFDASNCYIRNTTGSILYTVFIFMIIYSPVLTVIRGKVTMERNIRIATFAFVLIPLTGAVIQIVTTSPMIVWNSVAMAIVAVFIFLELGSTSNDTLTGLNNRKQMEEWLYYRTSQALKTGIGFSVIMIDMDRFKQINDRFGHSEGDRALIHFARILNQCVKHEDNTSRFAGDEFLVSLETTQPEVIKLVIQRLENQLNDFNAKGIKEYGLYCSCGCSVFDPEKHKNYQDLVRDADNEMYRVKSNKQFSR